MKQPTSIPPEYRPWLENLKSRIRAAQIKAALSVNSGLIDLYREMGQMIDEKLERAYWGQGIIERLSLDLKLEFPNLSGFSRDNLYFMLRFFRFYQNADEFVEQLVRQIPWGHNILIFKKSDSLGTAKFYLAATIQNNWSRNILALQIESRLHERQGQAITNFTQTLPYIGIILCKTKNRIEVEYALRDLNKPIGVSQWILTQNLPAEIQSAFPTIEQLEQELSEHPQSTKSTNPY